MTVSELGTVSYLYMFVNYTNQLKQLFCVKIHLSGFSLFQWKTCTQQTSNSKTIFFQLFESPNYDISNYNHIQTVTAQL